MTYAFLVDFFEMNSDTNSNMLSEQEETCYSTISKGRIEEFIPMNKNDPILTELRHLFVSSFYEYYKTVEPQLNLPTGNSLLTWLEKAFDEESDDSSLSMGCRSKYT